MPQYSATISVMLKTVRKATKGLIRDFGELENLQVSRKGTKDFVSTADLKAEKILVEELQKARPKFGFLNEEGGEIKGEDSSFRWVIDPLDGTINFLHGTPFFCTNLALEQTHPNGKREIIAAVTEVPVLKQTFWAEKGNGAWVELENSNARRLRVAARIKTEDSLFCLGSLNSDTTLAAKLAPISSGVRVIGSTALALAFTAAGYFDGFMQSKTSYWDIAAGILLIKESGGIITNIDNKNELGDGDSVIAANDEMHKILRKNIA